MSISPVFYIHAVFRLVDPESIKKIDNLSVILTLLGSSRIKLYVYRTLMKLSQESLSRFGSFQKTNLATMTKSRIKGPLRLPVRLGLTIEINKVGLY